MKKTEAKKQAIIEKLSDHLLAGGMKGSSLRMLAGAVGMSDRMLLHYFVDKEELMTSTLLRISAQLQNRLNQARTEPLPLHQLVPQLACMMKDPQIRPYLKLWLELAASAVADEPYHRTIARQICDSFFAWVASALQVEHEEDRRPLAALAFAAVEGLVLLDTLGADSLVASALEGIKKEPFGSK